MDRLDVMSVLVAVVEAGSLSAASRRLGTPLATVSRKVSELAGLRPHRSCAREEAGCRDHEHAGHPKQLHGDAYENLVLP